MSNRTHSFDNSGLIASALIKTDPSLAASVDAAGAWKYTIKQRGARVAKYRRYERGDHDSGITSAMRTMLRLDKGDGTGLQDFTVNYMRIVIDKMAGRLSADEITSTSPTGADTINQYINRLLDRNGWSSLQGSLYRAATRDGDSWVMIDPVSLKWTAEPSFDGFSGVVALFRQGSPLPVWACKIWSEADIEDLEDSGNRGTVDMRLVVYQPKVITQWHGPMNGNEVSRFEGVLDQGNGMGVVTPSSRDWAIGSIPIVHLVNMGDNYTYYGESELRAAIAPQDVLNRVLHSMVMASEFSAFKVSWSIGMAIEKQGITPGSVINLFISDEDGKPAASLTAEQIEFLKAVRVGEFSATDIQQYVSQMDHLIRQISQVTQTPIYGVTVEGGNLSGEALKQLEVGLVGKIRRFQRENERGIRSLIEMTSQIHREFDIEDDFELNPPEIKNGELSISWKNPEILDQQGAVATILAIREKAPGLFTDDFIRERLGPLLGLTMSKVKEESNKAEEEKSLSRDNSTGADGSLPAMDARGLALAMAAAKKKLDVTDQASGSQEGQ